MDEYLGFSTEYGGNVVVVDIFYSDSWNNGEGCRPLRGDGIWGLADGDGRGHGSVFTLEDGHGGSNGLYYTGAGDYRRT